VLEVGFHHLETDFARESFRHIALHTQSMPSKSGGGAIVSSIFLLRCLVEEESAQALAFCTNHARRLPNCERDLFCSDVLFPGALAFLLRYSHSLDKCRKFWKHLAEAPGLLPLFLNTLETEAAHLVPQVLNEGGANMGHVPEALVHFIQQTHPAATDTDTEIDTTAPAPPSCLSTLVGNDNIFQFFVDLLQRDSVSYAVKERVAHLIIRHMDNLMVLSKTEEVESCWRLHRLLGSLRALSSEDTGSAGRENHKGNGLVEKCDGVIRSQISKGILQLQQDCEKVPEDALLENEREVCYLQTLQVWQEVYKEYS
jgi:hypothetical protein